jgi:hypothetical protein
LAKFNLCIFASKGPEQVAKLLLEVDFLPFLDKLIYKNYKTLILSAAIS